LREPKLQFNKLTSILTKVGGKTAASRYYTGEMGFAQQKTRSFAASEFLFSPSFFLVVFVLGVIFQFCSGRLGSRR